MYFDQYALSACGEKAIATKTKKGFGGAAVTIQTRQADARPGFWTPVKAGILEYIPQFLVIIVGGAIVTAGFQLFGHLRDQSLEQAKFARQQFLQLRGDIDRLIAQRIIVTDRIFSRLKGGDYLGALELRKTTYDQAIAEWNQNAERFFRPLHSLSSCKSECEKSKFDAPECILAKDKGCLIRLFYDARVNSNIDADGYALNTDSVHFAFFNASNTLIKVINSDWAVCLELLQNVRDQAKKDCASSAKAAGPAGFEPAKGFDETIECIKRLDELRSKGIASCDRVSGASLKDRLKDELATIRQRWEILDRAFSTKSP